MEILDYDEKLNKVKKEIEKLHKEDNELQQKILKLNLQLNYLEGYLACLKESNMHVVKD